MENIPEDVTFSENGTSHLPLSAGLHSLLDLAVAGHSVEIVSPQWNLNSSDYESRFLQSSRQVSTTTKQVAPPGQISYYCLSHLAITLTLRGSFTNGLFLVNKTNFIV